MASQVQPPALRAAKSRATQLPEFLRDGRLVADIPGEDLWATASDVVWIVPHPYRGQGERKIDYADAMGWMETKYQMPRPEIEKYLAEKGIFSHLPERQQEEHEWFKAANHRRLRCCLKLGPVFSGIKPADGYSAEFVLDLVCGVIVDHEETLVAMGIKANESGEAGRFALCEETLTAARAVVARARWNGLKATPMSLDYIEEHEYRREPLLLDLPGVNGLYPYTDRELLFMVCTFFYQYQQEIFDMLLPEMKGRKRLALAEAMVFAEQEIHRGSGGGTELDNLRRNELSKWQCVMKDARASLHHPFLLRMRQKLAA